MPDTIRSRTLNSLDAIDRDAWNALTGAQYPFLRHEFLSNLEQHDCLGQKTGWVPAHKVFETADGQLVAGVPMYEKSNSFGEFIFDWAWANAYHHHGIEYYPKLVIASPFTPATGPRILIAEPYRSEQMQKKVIRAVIEEAARLNFSGLHILFVKDRREIEQPELLKRTGFQFHWHNHGYTRFNDFTDLLTSKKRKQINRERRRVAESGIRMERILGRDVSEAQWLKFYEHYRSTFLNYGNYPALTLPFFLETARMMGEQLLLVTANRNQQMIASSFFLVGDSTLYGRYWGCTEEVPGLHFETCYYQGIEFCIEKGLSRFEPGAQGEHKISRGFLPVPTWSGHWIRDSRFRNPISAFVEEESRQVCQRIKDLAQHSPYRVSSKTRPERQT